MKEHELIGFTIMAPNPTKKKKRITEHSVEKIKLSKAKARGWLVSTYPFAFNPDCNVPLCEGVLGHSLTAYDDKGGSETLGFTKNSISTVIFWWLKQKSYREAVAKGGSRYTIGGKVKGCVSEEEMQFAKDKLDRKLKCKAE